MSIRTHPALCAAALCACCAAASAADVFRVTATVGTQTGSIGLSRVEDVFNELSDVTLSNLVPSYTGIEPATVEIQFRGLLMSAAFPFEEDPQLQLSIPSLGISQTFFGQTREESRQLLRDYFKNGVTLGQIMRELARVSPVDPLAGNPASLQSQMVAGSFARNFGSLAGELAARELGRPVAFDERPVLVAAAGQEAGGVGLAPGERRARPPRNAGVDVARYTRGGIASTIVGVPLGVAFGDAERSLLIDGTLQYTDTAGAKSYGVTATVSYRMRMADRWHLVPSASYGLTASEHLGSAGQIVSASLTSAFRLWQSARYSLWMGNAANALRALKTSVAGYSFDPDLSNVAITNGLMLSTTPSILSANSWVEYSFADTRYTGSDLYDKRYDEIGVALVRSLATGAGVTTLRFKLSALRTTHSKGIGAQFQATF